MVEQLPVKRQLSRVNGIEKRGEFGETLSAYAEGDPEPSSKQIGEGVETIPQGSSSAICGTKRLASQGHYGLDDDIVHALSNKG